MTGYIKCFQNGAKKMSFLSKDCKVWEKYNEIWNIIKNKLNIKFHSMPVKVKEIDGIIKTNFLGNELPK